MSVTKFSFKRGLFNAISALLFFIVLPGLFLTMMESSISGLDLGGRTLSTTAAGAFIAAVAFCRGAFPRHSVTWALAGIGSSLFAAMYIYILLGTPASITTSMGGQTATYTLDVSLFALVIAAVMALNSLNNFIELADARRRKTETERVAKTKIAA